MEERCNLQNFSYQVPEFVHRSTKLPILDSQGKTVCMLQKRPHKFIAAIFNATLRTGVNYTYKILSTNEEALYSLDCWFPGINYELIDHFSSNIVPISQQRVQLLEKAYSFTLMNQDYYFKKDHTGTGYLNCENKTMAIVSMPYSLTISVGDTIHVKAQTEQMAALSAVLFHTFYYYNA